MYGKKGLSTVVATVSLVLLTFVAVVIISGYIIPLVRDGLNEGTECSDYRDYFVFNEEFGYNCFAGESGDWLYGVSVEAGSVNAEAEKEVKGFRLSFITSNGESKSVDVENGGDSGSEIGQIRRINTSLPLEIPKSGGVRTYVYRDGERFESVQVAPKLESERVCPRSDSIRIEGVICEKELTVE